MVSYTRVYVSNCNLICVINEVFTAGALEARVRRTSAFRAPSGKIEWCMANYVNTRELFCIYYTPDIKYPLLTAGQLEEELYDMRYVIWTAISHSHIK